jgi:hypothetical protein
MGNGISTPEINLGKKLARSFEREFNTGELFRRGGLFRVAPFVPTITLGRAIKTPDNDHKYRAQFDIFLFDPIFNLCTFLEVTLGDGKDSHKESQFLVAEAAHLPNLNLITNDLFHLLNEIDDPVELYWVILTNFYLCTPQSLLKATKEYTVGLERSFGFLEKSGFFEPRGKKSATFPKIRPKRQRVK